MCNCLNAFGINVREKTGKIDETRRGTGKIEGQRPAAKLKNQLSKTAQTQLFMLKHAETMVS